MEKVRSKRKNVTKGGYQMKNYMYIAIRSDLSRPQQTVQSVHAAIESSESYHSENHIHPSVILLGVNDEHELNLFEKYVQECDFQYKCFREPDRNNEKTSIAVYPVSEGLRQKFKNFNLLR